MRGKRDPSYRLHKASGQAVVTIDGRDFYLGKHGSDASRQAYHRTLLDWRKNGSLPAPRADAPLSIAALVARYWQHVERTGLYMKRGKPTSERTCLVVALRPLVRLYGATPAAEFGPKALKVVRAALTDPAPAKDGEKARRVHVGPRTRQSVNKHVHRIRGVFRWAVGEELLPASCWERLRALDALKVGAPGVTEGGKVKPAPLRHVVAVLHHVDDRTAAIIRLQWLTGARPGEVVQMRMGDIDRTRDVWIYRPGSHKNEHHEQEREVMLGPRAQKVLAPFVSADPAAWLFPGRDGPLTQPAYAKAVRAACDALKLPRWTPHQLRHNAGTKVRQVDGVDAAQTVLGHSTIDATAIYAEQDRAKAMRFARNHG